MFHVSASSIKLSEFRSVELLEMPRGKILKSFSGILRQSIFISTKAGSTVGWGREIPQLTPSQPAARLFPLCFPLLSLPLGCASPVPSAPLAAHMKSWIFLSSTHEKLDFPQQHTWKAGFPFQGCIVLHSCAFQSHCELLPRVKTELLYPPAQSPSCGGGRNIYKPVNLPPAPAYSSCHSSPFSQLTPHSWHILMGRISPI